MEDRVRVDAGEGTLSYETGRISGSSVDPGVALVSGRIGIGFVHCPNVTISNCRAERAIPDALLLCTSSRPVAKFGPHCVRINKPAQFFEALHTKLCLDGHVEHGMLGPVIYKDRAYKGTEPEPGHPGFIKPASFEDECEIRMFWPLDRRGTQPLEFSHPPLAKFCTQLS